MTANFLDTILGRPLSRPARWAWLAFFLPIPIAYIAGSLFDQQDLLRNLTGVAAGRESAIATARHFVMNRGIDAASWHAYTIIDPSAELFAYYRMHRDGTAIAAQSFSLPVTIRVLLVSGAGDSAEIMIDRSGRVAGYDLTRVTSATAAPPVDEKQAETVAFATVAQVPNLTKVLKLGKPETGTQEHTEGGRCRKFTWHAATGALPGLTFDINTAVCGTQPVRQTVDTSIDHGYAQAHSLEARTSLQVLIGVYVVYMAIVLIYALYRYARRAFEREVSHARTLLLGGIISAALMLGFLTAMDEWAVSTYRGSQSIQWFSLVAVAISMAVIGFTLAVMYEAGEGDLREIYPNKLTSLDALLWGKIFSRNVARSALFGAAFGGWILLLDGVLRLVLRPEPGSAIMYALKFPFFHFPLLAILMGQVTYVTLVPASGLLLPLGFLHRNIHRARLRNALLIVFVILACLINSTKYGSLQSACLGAALLTAILLVPFLAMDFLAVMFSLAAFQIAVTLARLPALSPYSTDLGVGVGCLGLGFLAIEAWAAVRGREFSADEVRPLYARHMVERQLLQAEMSAAREAQLHLLPKTVPSVNGLSISASCIPARVVGGDFYDFFPLGENRLGVFIAEGGNRGVGSALTIALAKGFLMHTVRRNLTPYEVITRLETALGTYLAGAIATTYVAYAIIDTGLGEIRYARTGEYPKVLVSTSLANEHTIDTPGSDRVVSVGTANLRGGDTIVLFTDGIAPSLRTTGARAAEDVLRALSRKRRASELSDDLTAVVVRITRVGGALEVVA